MMPARLVLQFVAAATLLSGCGAPLPIARFAGRTPGLSPEQFFAGDAQSSGIEETAAGAPSRRFTVASHGVVLPDGRLRLDQTLNFEGSPPRVRTWLISKTGAHNYQATLTDADGTVSAEAQGDLFHLTYAMKGVPFGSMEQWLYLQPDGCTVMNEGVVRIAGFAIRRISERISRVAKAGGC